MTLRRSVSNFARVSHWIFSKAQLDRTQRGFASSVSSSDAVLRRSALFSNEKKKQRESVGRIEKIDVKVVSNYGNELLVMNKDLSTPYDCARHITEHLSKHAFVAMVDSSKPWDMHKTLSQSCELGFLFSTDKNPWISNNAFWRSCSFMMGAVVSKAFRNDIPVILHSFPYPNVYSGSFVLDAYIGLESWTPSEEELRALSREMIKLSEQQIPFEHLSVSEELASDMFSDNPYKLNHISKIFENHNEVVVYRLGDHVDISRGPMMNHTGLLGRCTIASVHHLKDDQLFRFQGVALPQGHKLNHYAYGILERRARYLNEYMLPSHASNTFQPTPEFESEALVQKS